MGCVVLRSTLRGPAHPPCRRSIARSRGPGRPGRPARAALPGRVTARLRRAQEPFPLSPVTALPPHSLLTAASLHPLCYPTDSTRGIMATPPTQWKVPSSEARPGLPSQDGLRRVSSNLNYVEPERNKTTSLLTSTNTYTNCSLPSERLCTSSYAPPLIRSQVLSRTSLTFSGSVDITQPGGRSWISSTSILLCFDLEHFATSRHMPRK